MVRSHGGSKRLIDNGMGPKIIDFWYRCEDIADTATAAVARFRRRLTGRS